MSRPLPNVPSRESQCAGKLPFTKRRAKKVLRWMRARGGPTHRLEVYRCFYCRHWHLGNRPEGI